MFVTKRMKAKLREHCGLCLHLHTFSELLFSNLPKHAISDVCKVRLIQTTSVCKSLLVAHLVAFSVSKRTHNAI